MKRGFTVIELIVGLTLGLLIFLALLTVFTLSRQALRKGSELAEIDQNGRIALERIAREIRQAEEIISALPENSTAPAHEITFQDGHDVETLTYIRYYLSGASLHRETSYYNLAADLSKRVRSGELNPDGTPAQKTIIDDQVIAEFVANLSFWGTHLINISMQLLEGSTTATISTTLYGRNLH